MNTPVFDIIGKTLAYVSLFAGSLLLGFALGMLTGIITN